jgi:hypothetical protein
MLGVIVQALGFLVVGFALGHWRGLILGVLLFWIGTSSARKAPSPAIRYRL